MLWDFHDLLFHTRSTEGRQANPLGGLYPYAGVMPPLPAVRPRWPGKTIDLRKFSAAPSQTDLADRKAVARTPFDPRLRRPAADHACRTFAVSRQHRARPVEMEDRLDFGDGGPEIEYAARPYPSAGSAYELELYLAVANCEGLPRGFYHYDAGRHALVPIGVARAGARSAVDGSRIRHGCVRRPQVLITIAARFGRVSWKYSSIAYSLILKDVGVLIQTLYLMATDMGLGGCAIGTSNIDLFARMTGIEFHVEGPVGQFALGRGAKPDNSD